MKALQNTAYRLESFSGRNRKLDQALGLRRGEHPSDNRYPPLEQKGRFAVISKLESNVSRLQIARENINQLRSILFEMRQFIRELWERQAEAGPPESVIDSFLENRLLAMRHTAENASFQGRALLNGKSGTTASIKGENLYFVRGSARVLNSPETGYPVVIQQAPRAGSLGGGEKLNESIIQEESLIVVKEGTLEARYKIQREDNPLSLIQNLQKRLWEQGFDITVYRTPDNRLLLSHNQLGSGFNFEGMSLKTRLLSSRPGEFAAAEPGLDVRGSIGMEAADGDGGFLIGRKSNRKTDGLVVFYNGRIDYPGQVAGHIMVRQNGYLVPLDLSGETAEILSIPSLLPREQSVGVSNPSGFMGLEKIRAKTEQEQRDSLKLILWSLRDMEFLIDELKWKEDFYVNLAIKMLKGAMTQKTNQNDIMLLSKDKAELMVTQLKTMLKPAAALRIIKANNII